MKVDVDDPWGFGNSLEWATTCPPPLRNFHRLPGIRSERPAFDLKYCTKVSDLGREVRQGDAQSPQSTDSGTDASYQAVSVTSARKVEVPEPGTVKKPGEGVGDIRGLSERLDYLSRLGVTTLWLNPIHPSPRRDGGYDITDHYGIDPVIGSLGDFAVLLSEAAEPADAGKGRCSPASSRRPGPTRSGHSLRPTG
jgi:hypothetical protein